MSPLELASRYPIGDRFRALPLSYSNGMRKSQRGFSLIELMVVVAIIGILASIAMPTFMSFSRKSKQSEARIQISAIEKRIRLYQGEKQRLPQTAALFPATEACAHAEGKIPAEPQSAWDADPGWREIGFHLDEAHYFRYSWTQTSPTSGLIVAVGDLDCDGEYAMVLASIAIVEGNTFESRSELLEDE